MFISVSVCLFFSISSLKIHYVVLNGLQEKKMTIDCTFEAAFPLWWTSSLLYNCFTLFYFASSFYFIFGPFYSFPIVFAVFIHFLFYLMDNGWRIVCLHNRCTMVLSSHCFSQHLHSTLIKFWWHMCDDCTVHYFISFHPFPFTILNFVYSFLSTSSK